jgi:outer membrane protein OmpA-like peptidoglycan-associated protein
MSKDKNSTSFQAYFISGIVILFFGLLYLFLSDSFNVGFNKDNSQPTSVTTPPLSTLPLASLQNYSTKLQQQASIDRVDTLESKGADDTQKVGITSQSPANIDSQVTQQQQNSNGLVYKLPDGAEVTISTQGFANKFKQAIENEATGKPIIFDRVYFVSGSDKLDKQSNHQISETAALLNAYQKINIAIRGHSDNKGSFKKNSILSLLRSGNMKKALVNLGIDSKRIQIEGIGDQEPIASNKTKRGRRNNRRIDLIIKQ